MRYKSGDTVIFKFGGNATKVVALGKTAEKALTAIVVDYYALCHPSPLNRILNHPAHLETLLKGCREYISAN